MKHCNRCDLDRPLSEWSAKHRWCRSCQREYARARFVPGQNVEYMREWYAANKAKHAVSAAAWHAANLDKVREAQRAYKRRNLQKGAEYQRRRVVRQRGLPSEPIDVRAVGERDGWRCHVCQRRVSPQRASLDHLIPVSADGPHTYENVAVTHLRCNLRRGAGRIAAQLPLLGRLEGSSSSGT